MSENQIVDAEVIEAPPAQEPQKPGAIVPISAKGLFEYTNQLELSSAAMMLIKLKLAPEHLRKEGVAAVGAAMIFCRQFNLPDKAMNEMAWVKGKLTQFGSLVTALAEKHPQYGEKREFFLDDKQEVICWKAKNLNAEPWAAVVEVRKKGEEHWTEFFFTMDEAKNAELLGNPTWKKYRKDMLMHKARARALKASYAAALNGVDYHEDVLYDLEADPHQDTKDLNKFFKGGEANGNPEAGN